MLVNLETLKKNPFFDKRPQSVFYHETAAGDRLSRLLSVHLTEKITNPIVLVCIGTDRSTGDSLGPLVGSKLSERGLENFNVFGTLEEPVHALNLEETLVSIQKQYVQPFVIALDACLGKAQSIGAISVGQGPSKPGAAMNKKLPPVGNIHIHGVVNIQGFMEFFVLQNTRLNLVMKMADVIAAGIQKTDRHLTVFKKINHL